MQNKWGPLFGIHKQTNTNRHRKCIPMGSSIPLWVKKYVSICGLKNMLNTLNYSQNLFYRQIYFVTI